MIDTSALRRAFGRAWSPDAVLGVVSRRQWGATEVGRDDLVEGKVRDDWACPFPLNWSDDVRRAQWVGLLLAGAAVVELNGYVGRGSWNARVFSTLVLYSGSASSRIGMVAGTMRMVAARRSPALPTNETKVGKGKR
jgi:hypothetical protein